MTAWRGLPDTMVVVSLPMTARFRGIEVREALLFEGPAGWAEFAPFADYDDVACVPWWQAAVEYASGDRPQAVRDSIPVNCTVPAVSPGRAAAIVGAGHGCTTAKVKVAERGQSLDDDVARVAAVRDVLGPQGRIRIDANGGWEFDEAATAVRELAPFGLEYVEQPCREVADLARVRALDLVPVAADESIRLAADPLRVVRAGACDVAVLKVAPLGGVAATLRIAEQIAIPVVVSSAVDTSVGLSAGVLAAACLPELPYACGLGTGSLLAVDVVPADERLRPSHGRVPVRRPRPTKESLNAVRADQASERRWRDRARRVAGVAR